MRLLTQIIGWVVCGGLAVWAVLVITGLWDRAAMAVSFLRDGSREEHELAWLQAKLGFLKRVAAEIGETERRLVELEKEKPPA